MLPLPLRCRLGSNGTPVKTNQHEATGGGKKILFCLHTDVFDFFSQGGAGRLFPAAASSYVFLMPTTPPPRWRVVCEPFTTFQQVLIDLHIDNSIYYCGNTLGRGGDGRTALNRGGDSGRLKVWRSFNVGRVIWSRAGVFSFRCMLSKGCYTRIVVAKYRAFCLRRESTRRSGYLVLARMKSYA